ncbi:MAG TPA: hypothetical protein VLA75_00635 [Thermoanaerobaculia bacterium]|nr:hypothetical protein [Thermoanaerobaculia bacterium]
MKLRTLIMAGAIMLALAGVVAAQTVAAPSQPAPVATTTLAPATTYITVAGKVVSSTSSELVIASDAGQEMTFQLDPKAVPEASFRVGERVTVKYHSLSGGTVYQAATVVVEPPAQAAPRDYEVTTSDDPPLPQTASGLPLMALFGLLAAGGAIAVRVFRS